MDIFSTKTSNYNRPYSEDFGLGVIPHRKFKKKEPIWGSWVDVIPCLEEPMETQQIGMAFPIILEDQEYTPYMYVIDAIGKVERQALAIVAQKKQFNFQNIPLSVIYDLSDKIQLLAGGTFSSLFFLDLEFEPQETIEFRRKNWMSIGGEVSEDLTVREVTLAFYQALFRSSRHLELRSIHEPVSYEWWYKDFNYDRQLEPPQEVPDRRREAMLSRLLGFFRESSKGVRISFFCFSLPVVIFAVLSLISLVVRGPNYPVDLFLWLTGLGGALGWLVFIMLFRMKLFRNNFAG